MTHFLLIHGSWHGALCWYKVAPLLEAEGHSVTVAELPGRGRHPVRPAFVGLRDMVKAMTRQLPPGVSFTTVAHSRYGILASLLAETMPERVERTIYLASYMLRAGERAADHFRADMASFLRPAVSFCRTGLWDWLDPSVYREALYHDCPVEDWMLGRLMLCREPLRPALTRLKLSEARYGAVPRAYIRLTEDRAVTPALQDRVLNATPVDRVEDIAASHSAYFSKAEALTRTLLKLAGS
ncbi:alpha/beta fold hydrolase [Hyphobacterium marinum]|uniref:Alpha/beta fold hydrolase n=1 Tax=Hyphobacterium marinum TaxID=3116574 RepID=A0ABU7M074_9PROT|nr:alpha/beta fold hydrolase [Hyphobacterium sp. Y6023]MEE2567214.1 alpha/beta fold hydrolase [Hyphobacterium sp. Y6023]